jgi:hypothetical protein
MATKAGELVEGVLTGDGRSTSFQPIPGKDFNIYLYGTFTATATLQRSFDGGTTWLSAAKPDLTAAAFTAPVNFSANEPRASTIYSWLISGFGSGSISYRFEQ